MRLNKHVDTTTTLLLYTNTLLTYSNVDHGNSELTNLKYYS